MSVEQPLEEILEELRAAEERWQKLLKEAEGNTEQLVKPDILNIGPKPIRRPKAKFTTREPFIPVVPVPVIKRNRGDFISRMKRRLNVLKCELSQTGCPAVKTEIEGRIKKTKLEMKIFKKQKKNGKHTNQN